MAGGGGVAACVNPEIRRCHESGLKTDKDLLSTLTAFDSTLESSRILQFWTSEEAQCAFERLWTVASRLLLRGPSNRRFFSSHPIVDLVVYLSAKFGALNPRINEIRSGANSLQPVSQVQKLRFTIPPISWLSDLVAMFPRASGTIVDNILHASSHSSASCLRGIRRPQTHTQNGKFH